MQALLDNPAFKLYAISASILAIQLLLLAFYTGGVRARSKTFVNAEDAATFKGATADADHPDVRRVQRAHQNLIENALPFLGVGLLYVLTNPSVMAAQIFFFGFVAVRLLHSAFYLANKQPFRTMTFAVGALLTIGMAVQVIRAVA
jgi:prostaglandin-E synthase 1